MCRGWSLLDEEGADLVMGISSDVVGDGGAGTWVRKWAKATCEVRRSLRLLIFDLRLHSLTLSESFWPALDRRMMLNRRGIYCMHQLASQNSTNNFRIRFSSGYHIYADDHVSTLYLLLLVSIQMHVVNNKRSDRWYSPYNQRLLQSHGLIRNRYQLPLVWCRSVTLPKRSLCQEASMQPDETTPCADWNCNNDRS